MNGFLLDENLPPLLRFTPSKPVRHVRELGVSLTDPEVWEIAKAEDLVVITKTHAICCGLRRAISSAVIVSPAFSAISEDTTALFAAFKSHRTLLSVLRTGGGAG